MEKQKGYFDYGAVYRLSQTKGWNELSIKLLKKDEQFFNRLLKKRSTKNDSSGQTFITDIHDIGHARGMLEMIEKINNVIETAIRKVETKQLEEED